MTRPILLALSLLPALLPSDRSSPLPQPQFRSSTLGVRLDVLVTDGRKPVSGLAAADFEVRDIGVPQSIQLIDGAGWGCPGGRTTSPPVAMPRPC